jgi:hypothetical protein
VPHEIKAADLPDLTVVAIAAVVYVKNHPTDVLPWRATNGGYCADWLIDEKLREGGQVLRWGDGTEARERLARHLWITDAEDADVWDHRDAELAKLRAKGENGEWLALGVEERVARLFAQADEVLAVITGTED